MPANLSGGAPLDSLTLAAQNLKRAIQAIPGVIKMSYSSNNSPYTMNDFNNNITHNNISVQAQVLQADDNFPAVMQTKMASGRWFERQDDAAATRPIVINEVMAEKLFGSANPVGQVIDAGGKSKIVGVVKNLKDKGDYNELEAAYYSRGDSGLFERALIRIQPAAPPATESKIFKAIMHHLPAATAEIERMEDKRVVRNRLSLVPLYLMLVISGFLVLNVALGIYGVVWYSVNKRRAELGLRKAVGATAGGITRQIVGEALVLTTLPLLLGIILAVQFPCSTCSISRRPPTSFPSCWLQHFYTCSLHYAHCILAARQPKFTLR